MNTCWVEPTTRCCKGCLCGVVCMWAGATQHLAKPPYTAVGQKPGAYCRTGCNYNRYGYPAQVDSMCTGLLLHSPACITCTGPANASCSPWAAMFHTFIQTPDMSGSATAGSSGSTVLGTADTARPCTPPFTLTACGATRVTHGVPRAVGECMWHVPSASRGVVKCQCRVCWLAADLGCCSFTMACSSRWQACLWMQPYGEGHCIHLLQYVCCVQHRQPAPAHRAALIVFLTFWSMTRHQASTITAATSTEPRQTDAAAAQVASSVARRLMSSAMYNRALTGSTLGGEASSCCGASCCLSCSWLGRSTTGCKRCLGARRLDNSTAVAVTAPATASRTGSDMSGWPDQDAPPDGASRSYAECVRLLRPAGRMAPYALLHAEVSCDARAYDVVIFGLGLVPAAGVE
jgi:hypothetical protein